MKTISHLELFSESGKSLVDFVSDGLRPLRVGDVTFQRVTERGRLHRFVVVSYDRRVIRAKKFKHSVVVELITAKIDAGPS